MKINIKNTFITDDSRECSPGCYFLDDGFNSSYVQAAINQGAKITPKSQAYELLGINKELKIIGITGTNGKTTTAAAIYSILLDLGKKAMLIGTRGCFANDKQIAPKHLTTPFLLEWLGYLQAASKNECEYVVAEISSHAIAQNRFGDTKFVAKILTNITQDHLDYHGSFENYAACKASFFASDGLKIINQDAMKINYNVRGAVTYGIDNPALYSCKAYSLKDGIEAVFCCGKEIFNISSPLVGVFNIYNLLAAIACVNELKIASSDEISAAAAHFAGVRGRVQRCAGVQDVVIDFAHTPDGIANVCEALNDKPLIIVVGAGGDRDASKRHKMANIAAHFARTLIITTDNPRTENPLKIAANMLDGLDNAMLDKTRVILSRKMAIKTALKIARANERVLVLGKGDEEYQEINGVKYPFSDEQAILKSQEELALENQKEQEKMNV